MEWREARLTVPKIPETRPMVVDVGRVELPPALSPAPRRILRRGEKATFVARPHVAVRLLSVLVASAPAFCKWSLADLSLAGRTFMTSAGPHLLSCDVDERVPSLDVAFGSGLRVTIQNVDAEPGVFGVALLVMATAWLPNVEFNVWGERTALLVPPRLEEGRRERKILPMIPLDEAENAPKHTNAATLRYRVERTFRMNAIYVESDSEADVEVLSVRVGNREQLAGLGGVHAELFATSRSPECSYETVSPAQDNIIDLVNRGSEPRTAAVRMKGSGLFTVGEPDP